MRWYTHSSVYRHDVAAAATPCARLDPRHTYLAQPTRCPLARLHTHAPPVVRSSESDSTASDASTTPWLNTGSRPQSGAAHSRTWT